MDAVFMQTNLIYLSSSEYDDYLEFIDYQVNSVI